MYCEWPPEDSGKKSSDQVTVVNEINAFLLQEISPKALFSVGMDRSGCPPRIMIEVPGGPDQPYVLRGAIYLWQDGAIQAANADQIRTFLQADALGAARWERRPSPAMDEDVLDKDLVRSTARQARDSGRFPLDPELDEIEVLRRLGLYSSGRFTQAADVLFSKNPAVRHPQVRVQVTRYGSGKEAARFADHRQVEGPLPLAFEQVWEIVLASMAVTVEFPIGSPHRRELPSFPPEAVREGLVNAFVHRDYASFSGGLSVGIHPDRIVIWNSGHFPDGIRPGDLRRDHPSLPTNPDIAHVFYLRRLMERVGRGGQLIVQEFKRLKLPPPRWEDRPDGVRLTMFSRGSSAKLSLNERQQALLAALPAGQPITLQQYFQEYAAGITDRQARRDLARLEAQGLLIRSGKGPTTAYSRPKDD